MLKAPWIFMGTFQNRDYDLLLENVQAGLNCNVMGYDTAPSYKSEKSLGKVVKTLITQEKVKREELFISDKIDAWQMQEGNGDVRVYIEDALQKMQLSYFDLILIHWPIAEYLYPTYKCLLNMKEEGLIRNIGVCNVRLGHLQRINLI